MAAIERNQKQFIKALSKQFGSFNDFELMQVLRLLEDVATRQSKSGRGANDFNSLLLKQQVRLDSVKGEIHSMSIDEGSGKVEIRINGLGLLGSTGPLPLHITEYIHQRAIHENDTVLQDFLNIFFHRYIALLYQVWARRKPYTITGSKSFTPFLKSLMGLKDVQHASNYLHHLGVFVKRTKSREGLEFVLSAYFSCQVVIKENVEDVCNLPADQCWSLGSEKGLGNKDCFLNRNIILGRKLHIIGSKIVIEIEPEKLVSYEKICSQKKMMAEANRIVYSILGNEITWSFHFKLKNNVIDASRLNRRRTLGINSWLSTRKQPGDGFIYAAKLSKNKTMRLAL